MKRLIIVVLLVGIAAVAGIVRSNSLSGRSLSQLPESIGFHSDEAGEQVREEIRQSFELARGARVRVAGINGSVKIETADIQTAELLIERTASSKSALSRRRIDIESSPGRLEIRGVGRAGFFKRLFSSKAAENVTLRLPREVELKTDGVNGSVSIGQVDGPVEVHGVNGKVEVAQATKSAEVSGVNGNVSLALKDVTGKSVRLSGINGNIELSLADGLGAQLEAHGMNGNVVSDLPDFVLDRAKHGNYSAHVGEGGASIAANGINGNIRFRRAASPITTKSVG